MTNHPFISTRGLREPLEEEVEPTPQEKYDHAMKMLQAYSSASAKLDYRNQDTVEQFLSAFSPLCGLFADIYGIDKL